MAVVVFSGDKIVSLITSDTDTLLVYEETTLKWAAQLPFAAVSINRGSFKRSIDSRDLHRDLLVLSSGEGQLTAAYLGTEPDLFSAPAAGWAGKRELNYDETDRELAELNKRIKAVNQPNVNGEAPYPSAK